MSLLTPYADRAGTTLSRAQRRRLEAANDEFRKLYCQPPQTRQRARR